MRSLLHHIVGQPWAVTQEIADLARRMFEAEGLAGLRQLALARAELVVGPGLRAAAGAEDARGGPGARPAKSGVAVLPILGLISQRGGIDAECNLMASSAQVAEDVKFLAADPSVSAIVLEVDSPGGSVFGIPEAAAAIRDARASKPIVAHANSIAGSAAYWLFSQATEGMVSPSGQVGSIGVWSAHADISKELELKGRKVTLVYAGKYKVEGHPFAPLEDEARGQIQSEVNRYYDMFVRDVARGRKAPTDTVRGGFGEGRMVGAKPAVEMGMADAVGTLDEAIRRAAALGDERKRQAATVAQAQAMGIRRARGPVV